MVTAMRPQQAAKFTDSFRFRLLAALHLSIVRQVADIHQHCGQPRLQKAACDKAGSMLKWWIVFRVQFPVEAGVKFIKLGTPHTVADVTGTVAQHDAVKSWWRNTARTPDDVAEDGRRHTLCPVCCAPRGVRLMTRTEDAGSAGIFATWAGAAKTPGPPGRQTRIRASPFGSAGSRTRVSL